MKMKQLCFAVMALLVMPAVAQETYQDTKLVENELNGTARYVGMGGAMEALGADISTMSSNPAGIGLFRRSVVNISGGLLTQSDASTDLRYGNSSASFDGNKTNASFDQVGFVLSHRLSKRSFLNMGFNYHKSRNFDQILDAVGALSYASQNKNTAYKYDYAQSSSRYEQDLMWNAVDANYASMMYYDATNDQYGYLDGTAYLFGQYQKGYIGEYDFNISGNINDRVYLGLTFGVHDVNYRSNTYYSEDLSDGTVADTWEDLRIDGTGYDIKVGVIFRPIETSPFRIGLYVNTPVFYDLSMSGMNNLDMYNDTNEASSSHYCDYDFKVNTPWKFGISLGHTVENYLAMGLTYEYSDYGSIDNRINDGGYYDWYGYYYDTSSSDDVMNRHTSHSLKGVHTLKLGLEAKPMPEFAIRAGYNFISSVFEEDAFRDGTLASPGVAYATSTDYINWKATNRFTLGAGYVGKLFTVDLAYQYSATNGDFYPFMSYYSSSSDATQDNLVYATKVTNKRHQLLLTLGYKF